jgi:uncharacterized protein YacL
VVVFVEILRITVVLAGALVGLASGSHSPSGRILGAAIGVLVGYVAGGVAGRLIDRGVRNAARSLVDVPAPELLAGSFLGGLGFLIGVVICIPLFVFVKQDYDYPIAAGVAWIVGGLGLKLGMANGRQLAEAARITRKLSPIQEAPEGAVVVDTSAVMDQSFLVLGRAGLLGREILLPEPVADELQTLVEGPDPMTSRRARRALEAIDALKEMGIAVSVVPGDMPQAALTEEKVLRIAERLGVRLFTCSAEVARQEPNIGVPIIDLRKLCVDLAPEHLAGERLIVDLVKGGRQARQAVGFLPDGDMVVVNDAEHRLGESAVEVIVSSTRPTAQGMLVFASLAPEGARRP